VGKTSRLGGLLEEFGCAPGDRYALFGTFENDTGSTPAWQSRQAGADLDSLPGALRIDVAFVRPDTNDVMDKVAALLARLRDVHAGRVVVLGDAISCDVAYFAALGFEPRTSPSVKGPLFTWDPELADQPRAWNNADSWANPGNFSRFRW
jgi:hypothetical protein